MLIRPLLLLLFVLLPVSAWAQPAFVQCVTGAANSAATTTGAPGAAWTTGNVLVVVSGGATGGDAITSITQSSGSNNYASRPQAISNVSPGSEMWIAEGITGGASFTVTVNWSGSGDHAVIVCEYSGTTVRSTVASLTTGTTADASATLTASDCTSPRYVAGVVYNNTSTYTAGTRTSVNGAGISVAIADNTSNTVAVTHASGTWRIGMVELVPNTSDVGNPWTTGGTETSVDYWTGNRAGRAFTTGANATGYRVCVVKALYDSLSGGNVRAAIYDNANDPNKVRLAFSAANVACGTNAGADTRNMCSAPLSLTLSANTTYFPTMNVDSGHTQWQDGSTAITYVGEIFGTTPPAFWGTTSSDATGAYIWATIQTIAGGGAAAPSTHRNLLGVGP